MTPAQRNPEAERLIRDGLRQAPNAPYALVQTVLVQDEVLKRADARIRELEGAVATDTEPRDTTFLGGMRESLFGKREGRGSVPSVRSAEPASTSAPVSPAWHTGTQAPMPAATQAPMPVAPAGAPGAPGGSFLGTAAAAAAGVIGGSLLMSGIRSLMGNPQGAHAAFDPASGASGSSPWSGSGELAREAGLGRWFAAAAPGGCAARAAAAHSRARPASAISVCVRYRRGRPRARVRR